MPLNPNDFTLVFNQSVFNNSELNISVFYYTGITAIEITSPIKQDTWDLAGYLRQSINVPLFTTLKSESKRVLFGANLLYLPIQNLQTNLVFSPVNWLTKYSIKIWKYTGGEL